MCKLPNDHFAGQLGQQSPGLVSGIAPSSHKGHPQTISPHDGDLFFLAGQLGQQAPGFVSGTAPSAHNGQSHIIPAHGS